MQSNDDDSRRADACVLTRWKHRQRADEQSDLATLDDMQPLSVIKHRVDYKCCCLSVTLWRRSVN